MATKCKGLPMTAKRIQEGLKLFAGGITWVDDVTDIIPPVLRMLPAREWNDCYGG